MRALLRSFPLTLAMLFPICASAKLPDDEQLLKQGGSDAEILITKAQSILASARVFASRGIGESGEPTSACWALTVIVKYDPEAKEFLNDLFVYASTPEQRLYALAGLVCLDKAAAAKFASDRIPEFSEQKVYTQFGCICVESTVGMEARQLLNGGASRFVFDTLPSIFRTLDVSRFDWATSGKSFPERVAEFLDSPWRELSITTALCTDYGLVHATAVTLNRDDPKAVVRSTLPLVSKEPSKAEVTDDMLKELYVATLAAAKATSEYRYPMEIIHSMPQEQARELIKSGKLKIGPSDVEMLVIRVKTADTEVIFTETGPFSPLDSIIHRLFKTKASDVKDADRKSLLGGDPFEDAE